MLPGMGPAILTLPKAIAFRDAVSLANSDAGVIDAGGAQAGDCIVIIDLCRNLSGGAPLTVLADGFTSLANVTSNNSRMVVSYVERATAALIGQNNIMSSPANSNSVLCLSFQLTNGKALFVDGSVNPFTGDSEGMTISGTRDVPNFSLAIYGANGAVTGRPYSETPDAELSVSSSLYVKYRVENAFGAVSIDAGPLETAAPENFLGTALFYIQ